MNKEEVLEYLEQHGSDQTKKVLTKHGVKEPFFGVKIADLKKIVKKIKKDHKLALELYETGNSDAMYLAGLIADENLVTKEELNDWVSKAYWYLLAEYTVADLAAESKYGWQLSLQWIDANHEMIESAGWGTLCAIVSIKNNSDLKINKLKDLLYRVEKNISTAKNRIRYTMNYFVICVGSYIPELNKLAMNIAKKIGKVSVNMGETSCKVPDAFEYIQKVVDKGKLGEKRKSVRSL